MSIANSLTQVKLNNPLMGTETGVPGEHDFQLGYCHVKLNNPLMGTETLIWDFNKHHIVILR